MVDNVTLDAGTGGATIRTDDDGTAHWQYVKLAFGADNTQTIVGSTSSNPLPVALSDTDNTVLDNIQTAVQVIDNPIIVDDAAFTPATTSVSMLGAFADETATDSVDEGDGGAVRMTLDRILLVQPRATNNSTRGLTINASGRVEVDLAESALDLMLGSDFTTVFGTADLVKAEDEAHSTGDAGIMGLAVRNDTLAALAGTDGDYAPLQVDENGAVYTALGTFVSANNSTTATLTASTSYTGTGDDLLGYATVSITLDASHDSAADGMTFEFSTDNSNWDDVYTFTYTAANGARRFQFPITARYFRVNYTNGGTNQTHFRVQTILHPSNTLTSVHRLGDNMSSDRSAQIMKTALFAQLAGSGDFTAIDASAGGNLKVSVQEFSDGVDVGNGAVGSETLRVTIASDTTGVLSVDDNGGALTVDNGGTFVVQEDGAALTALQLIDNTVAVLGTATYSEGTTSGNVIGAVRNDALATLVNTDNEIAPLQVNDEGALYTTPQAYNRGGCKSFSSIDLDEAEEQVAGGACTVYSMYFWNSTAAPLWAQIFNATAASIAPGTDAPDMNFIIPANADSDGAGVVVPIPACGLEFTTALSVAVTTGSGTNAGAPGANAAGAIIMYED